MTYVCLSVDKSQLKTAARKSQTTVSLTYLVNLNGTEGALSEYLATRVDWGSRDICVIVSDGKAGGSGQRVHISSTVKDGFTDVSGTVR